MRNQQAREATRLRLHLNMKMEAFLHLHMKKLYIIKKEFIINNEDAERISEEFEEWNHHRSDDF